jgi:ADP-ribosyl-[dinitrogen reductase] hydrolase
MDKLKNTIYGALYGVAVGDALGAPLEFMNAEEIQNKHGFVTKMIGGGWLSVAPGEVTDDTQMTLAVAEGIAAEPENPIEAVGERFIAWITSRPKDVGGTCSASIRHAQCFGGARPSEDEWFKASQWTAKMNGNRSGGNGALMRTIFPGLFYRSRLEAVETATAIAQMTHWDKESNEACEIYTHMIHLITEAEESSPLLELERLLGETQYSLENLYKYRLNPTGYVVDSMKCAIECIRMTQTFESAVTRAANLGGDADTIAAITGGLAGAFYGFKNIPRKWVLSLSYCDKMRLEATAESAYRNRKQKE